MFIILILFDNAETGYFTVYLIEAGMDDVTTVARSNKDSFLFDSDLLVMTIHWILKFASFAPG